MPPDDQLASITVTIPQRRAGDLLTYAATLHKPTPDEATEPITATVPEARIENGEGVALDALRMAGPGLTGSAVRRSYHGGDSGTWRPFLQLLAHRPERWVHWPELYTELGLKNVEAAGMLGAAERRCKGLPPYVKSRDSNEHYFWMPQDVADLILTFAEPE